MENVLEMTGINKAFSGVPVLKNVDFSVEKGTVHALIGENGAGKSTLMKILTGIYTKDSGEMRVQGTPVNFKGYKEANNCGIRMIFQEMSNISTLTVAENIFLNNEITKHGILDKREMRRQTGELMQELQMDISPNAVIADLSVGNCQLVEIAKAIAGGASILIMDEPTSSLSDSEVEILFSIIKTLKGRGVSIVYISHRLQEVLDISDMVTVLRDGEKVVTKPTGELDLQKIIGHMLGEGNKKAFAWRPPAYSGEAAKLLEVEHLAVNHIVQDVSFHVNRGEVVGLAGLMGSGRTEILETLFGILRAQGGTIRLEGQPVEVRGVRDAVDHGIGLVPEDRRRKGLVLMHSLKQNMALTLLKKISRLSVIQDKKLDGMAKKGVRDLNVKTAGVDGLVRLLSGGNQQKIVIAKWLESDLKLLMLDEPTAGIDIGSKSEIIDIIRKFADAGNGVIFVSSEIPELLAVCDRILIIQRGKLTGGYRHSEIESEEVVQRAIQL